MLHEVLVWNRIKKGQLNGLDFDRQKVIGRYIVDFYCPEERTVIEIDGSSHAARGEYDETRQRYLESLGLNVVRIDVDDVLKNLDNVIVFLQDHPALTGTPP